MIDFLSKWIEGIVLAVILASIFEMILPNGNIKKYIKIILGIYIIFSIISPFVDSKQLYSIDAEKEINEVFNYETTNTKERQTTSDINKIYTETFENEIKKAIENQGYNVYKCIVKGNFSIENETTGIERIDITLDSKKDSNEKNEEDFEEDNQNKIKIENINEIEKVDINIGDKNKIIKNIRDITLQDITDLKRYLSEHYEIDKKIINIQKR